MAIKATHSRSRFKALNMLFIGKTYESSEISIDEHSFNKAAPLYQKALDDSGYNHCLTFTPNLSQSSNTTTRNHHRNIIWFSPAFSKSVAANVGRTFLKIVNEELPESHVAQNL